MTDAKQTDKDRVQRVSLSFPVASFTLKASNIAWLGRQAKRLGTSKSEYLRGLLDRDEAEQEGKAA